MSKEEGNPGKIMFWMSVMIFLASLYVIATRTMMLRGSDGPERRFPNSTSYQGY